MPQVHIDYGTKSEVAVVLCCPGQKEKMATPPGPAKGQTGVNLNEVLGILTTQYGQTGFTRPEVTITNAWDKVEFAGTKNGGTNRRQPTPADVLAKTNLDRLELEIKGITKCIIACGEIAEAAVEKLHSQGKLHRGVAISKVAHLGNSGLNSTIDTDIDGNRILKYSCAADKPPGEKRSVRELQGENRRKRLAVVAKKIDHDLP